MTHKGVAELYAHGGFAGIAKRITELEELAIAQKAPANALAEPDKRRESYSICASTGRAWVDCDCGNCERGPSTRVPGTEESACGKDITP